MWRLLTFFIICLINYESHIYRNLFIFLFEEKMGFDFFLK